MHLYNVSNTFWHEPSVLRDGWLCGLAVFKLDFVFQHVDLDILRLLLEHCNDGQWNMGSDDLVHEGTRSGLAIVKPEEFLFGDLFFHSADICAEEACAPNELY